MSAKLREALSTTFWKYTLQTNQYKIEPISWLLHWKLRSKDCYINTKDDIADTTVLMFTVSLAYKLRKTKFEFDGLV